MILLSTAWRSLLKNKFFSILNVTGLALGMAVFLLVAHYVRFERSYESFIPDVDNIYRVALHTYQGNDLIIASAETYPGVGPAFASDQI